MIAGFAELAGHKSIAMTMRYAHLAPSHLDAACEKSANATEPKNFPKEQQVVLQ